jgi:PIN domain nuclease of toxin-antitoxin system
MASVILLDTHVLVWLYQGPARNIPRPVRERLDRERLALSPFVQLELMYLYESGRVRAPAQLVLDHLRPRLELVVADVSAVAVCSTALGLSWTRDPFDRMLAAHAIIADVPLVTKDAIIRQNLPLAWWAESAPQDPPLAQQ